MKCLILISEIASLSLGTGFVFTYTVLLFNNFEKSESQSSAPPVDSTLFTTLISGPTTEPYFSPFFVLFFFQLKNVLNIYYHLLGSFNRTLKNKKRKHLLIFLVLILRALMYLKAERKSTPVQVLWLLINFGNYLTTSKSQFIQLWNGINSTYLQQRDNTSKVLLYSTRHINIHMVLTISSTSFISNPWEKRPGDYISWLPANSLYEWHSQKSWDYN